MKKISIICISLLIHFFSLAQTVPYYVDTNGLLGWYPFNGNAQNAYGTGLNGSVVGPTLTTDRFGDSNKAYHFNGMWDHIVIDSAFFNIGWSSYTISLWMKNDSINNPNNVNNDQFSVNTIPHNGIGVSYNWGNSGRYDLYANSDPSLISWNILGNRYSHADITSHVWNHLVFEKLNDTTYSFYLNGHLDSTYTVSTSAISYYCKIVFGNIDSSRGDEGVWGSLDDYGIWKRTLTGCEIKKLFNSTAYLFLTAQPSNSFAAAGTITHFNISDTGIGNTYQWQSDSGAGYTNITSGSRYSGVLTPTLTVSDIIGAMNGYSYRCIVTGSEGCVDTSLGGSLLVVPSSVNNISSNTTFSISPNPTTGDITITAPEQVSVKIFNTSGQLIKYQEHASAISIADCAAGLYLIKLFNDSGSQVYYDRIIKK